MAGTDGGMLTIGLDGTDITSQDSKTVDRTIRTIVNPLSLIEQSMSSGITSYTMAVAARDFLKFIPKNYVILDSIRGNLNNDAYEDFILVLKKNNEDETSNFYDNKPEKRPLLIFLGNANKKLDLKLRTDNAVLCVDGSGAIHGDSYEGIKIKDGYFTACRPAYRR